MKYKHRNGTEIEEFFKCRCGFVEHMMIFQYWAENGDEDKELYLNIHLSNYMGFFKRLWVGIKYIMGYSSDSGHFDEIIIRKDDIDRLFNLVDTVKKDMDGENN